MSAQDPGVEALPPPSPAPGAWPRPRTVRDPIHGDVFLYPIQAAVVGSLVFQRLRYIRQNGLLHFVFPGAVHTRFAHSLGTLAVAARVWARLLLPVPEELRTKYRPTVEYVGMVFELAALLHDVGHCAFSHSIEGVRPNGKPLLGSITECFKAWHEGDLLNEYLVAYPESALTDVKHEQIGLMLVRKIFAEPKVSETCKRLNLSAADLGRDVRSILDDGLMPSNALDRALAELASMFATAGKSVSLYDSLSIANFAQDLRAILHVLVSGTLDVDRLDYLIRDAVSCGVSYGRCDTRMLISSLDVGVVGDHVELLLDAKATFTLDDMLWSRYQMFMQVYNHKTNVVFNEMLTRAMPEAFDDARLDRPRDYESYIAFTDDLVMSTVLSLCIRSEKVAATVYGQTLAHRRIPRHLGSVQLKTGGADEIEACIIAKAGEVGLARDKLIIAKATSELIKAGPLPKLVSWDKPSGQRRLAAFDELSTLFGGKALPRAHRLLHFYSGETEQQKGS